MTRTDESVTDASNALAETFDVCPDCGTPTVQLENHRCQASDADPEEGRDEDDPYPDEEPVLVLTSLSQTSHPYHDLDANGDPLCPASCNSTATEYTRGEAKDRGFGPCQFCQRIRRSHEPDHVQSSEVPANE